MHETKIVELTFISDNKMVDLQTKKGEKKVSCFLATLWPKKGSNSIFGVNKD